MTPVRTLTLALPEPNIAEIRRYAKCPSGTDDALRYCITELSDLKGSVCYCECDISQTNGMLDLEFAKTQSQALGKALAGCDKIILFAATVGIFPDRLIAKYNKISPVKALFVQAIGAERIEAVCDAFCNKMQEEYAEKSFSLCGRFSPGYGDLPLTLQKDIFQILDCPRKIGVTLSEGLLMMPSKSVTAIVGIRKNKEKHL